MNTTLISLLSLVLGTLLGGVVKAVQDRYMLSREGQAVAGALRAEIESLNEIIRLRAYVETFRKMLALLADETYVIGPNSLVEIRVTQHYFQIFDGHCNKIGLLGPAAAAVVSWYTLAKAVVEDLRFLPERHRSERPFTREQLVSLHREIVAMFEELLRRGTDAAERLAEYERRRFLWTL
jgi:hypothetical protein